MRAPPSTILLLSLSLFACTGFREALPGVYRSPQPSENQLMRRIVRHDIQTVICLRGGGSARLTARATHGAGCAFLNVPLSANHHPKPAVLLELWRIAAEATRPLLFHCRAGVDRTGLALAIVVLHDTGSLDQARSQLALIPNGHLAAFGPKAMDEVLDAYEPFDGILPFPNWVERVYSADWAAARAAEAPTPR